MSRYWRINFAAALASGAISLMGCGHGPPRATQKAIEAIERAAEYRDESREYYEPRYLDAQRAAGDIPDQWAAEQGRICMTELRTYRLALAGRVYALEALERKNSSDAREGVKEAQGRRIDQGVAVDKCLAELRALVR